MEQLTLEQRNYFLQRLNDITEDKLNAKRTELFGEGGSEYAITWGMVFEAIKAGEIVLKEGQEKLTRAYLKDDDVVWDSLQAKRDELKAYKDTLANERKTLMDTVLLGEGAVAALATYANM